MAKLRTHYEQVSLETVKKIAEVDVQVKKPTELPKAPGTKVGCSAA
jgi:hypothetical protein